MSSTHASQIFLISHMIKQIEMTQEELALWKTATDLTRGQEGANLKARELFEKLKYKQMETGIKETKVPSFGEQLIGIQYDPTNEDLVIKVKSMFAEIAELMKKDYHENNRHPLKSLLFDHAVGEVVNAQMAVVKLITLKHYTDEVDGEKNPD